MLRARGKNSFSSGMMGQSLRAECSLTLLRKARRIRACSRDPGMEAGRPTLEGQAPKLVLLFIYLKIEGRGLCTEFFV